MHKFSGGSGLFAQGVQNDVDERMRVACAELVEKHRLEKLAKEAWEKEEATNFTGNLLQKAYINDADGVQRGGRDGVRADGKTGTEQAQQEEDAANETDSDDDLLAGADEELERIRQARIRQMKKIQANKKFGFGEYREIIEPEFLKQVTSIKKVVCHFYHDEFESCKIMDKHLKRICRHYPQVKFIKLNAAKAPFITAKLSIRTLPTLVFFDDGIAKDRICGFAELGGGQDFKTRFLEMRMMVAGVLEDETEFGAYPDDEEELNSFKVAR